MVIDIHAHYVAPDVIKVVETGKFGSDLGYDAERRSFQFPTIATRPMLPRMVDLDARLRHMDDVGVEMQLLSTWVDMLGPDLPEDTAVAFHRTVNEGLAAAVRTHPNRFRFLASVPLPFAQRAAAELRKAVEEEGAVGALIGTHVGGTPLEDPAFDAFWEAAQELGVPIVLHPLSRAMMPLLKDYYLGNLLGNPFETTVAASRLILGGVLDRFPTLQIVLVHGGGYLPYAVGRLDHGYQVRPEAKNPQYPPSNYLDRFIYDHVVFDPNLLAALVERVGSDQIVLGSDYPFDMEPVDLLGSAVKAMGPHAGEMLGNNTLRVFSRIKGNE